MDSLSGCLLINKIKGTTSRQEVNNVSHALNTKKCGHIGTLDPFATGLLIVLVGKATKIAPLLEREDKKYIATLKLGKATDTLDDTGKLIEEKPVPTLTRELIKNVFASFIGENEQVPPMYSAVRINGKHLYEYARKGEDIERKARKINIYSLELISFEKDSITFLCHVSKGTYVRTLAMDIAQKLGTVGHLVDLNRISIGEYSLDDKRCIASKDVKDANLISVNEMLKDFPSFLVKDKEAFKALNGVKLILPIDNEEVLIKDKDGIIALYQKECPNVYKCIRGLR